MYFWSARQRSEAVIFRRAHWVRSLSAVLASRSWLVRWFSCRGPIAAAAGAAVGPELH